MFLYCLAAVTFCYSAIRTLVLTKNEEKEKKKKKRVIKLHLEKVPDSNSNSKGKTDKREKILRGK